MAQRPIYLLMAPRLEPDAGPAFLQAASGQSLCSSEIAAEGCSRLVPVQEGHAPGYGFKSLLDSVILARIFKQRVEVSFLKSK